MSRWCWKCFLCPQRGRCQSMEDAVSAYWWHFRKSHRSSGGAGSESS